MRAISTIALLAAATLGSQLALAQTSGPANTGNAAGASTTAPPTGIAPATPAPSTGATAPGTIGAAPAATSATSAAATPAPATPTREWVVSSVIEKDLMGPDGKAIGDIDKVVESTSDQKKYLIVSSGGIMGFFETQVAVPLDRVVVQGDEIAVRDMTADQLNSLSKFDSSSYRDLGDSQRVAIAEKK